MSLDDLGSLEAAVVGDEFKNYVLTRHRESALSMLAESITEWVQSGCPRYDDREASCTVAVVGCLRRTIDERKSTSLQPLVALETGGWTDEHFSGHADPATVPRPDVALMLGLQHDVQMTIECKRLLARSATPRDYVKEGLCRFLTGRYPVDDGAGTMVGFLLDRDPPTAASEITSAVLDVIGRDEPLNKHTRLASLDAAYRSVHASADGDVRVIHLLIDIQGREPLHR